MKVECPRCGFKGELVDNKCTVCELFIEEQPPLSLRLIYKIFSIHGIFIAIGIIILGFLLAALTHVITNISVINLLFKLAHLLLVIGILLFILIQVVLTCEKIKNTSHPYKIIKEKIGEALVIIGIILMVFSLNMDTSVESVYGRVENIGLLNKKQNWIIISSVLFLAGIIITIYKNLIKHMKDK